MCCSIQPSRRPSSLRLKSQSIAAIQQAKAQPRGIASRLFPSLIYGEGHPYSNPFSGIGTEATVNSMTVDELRAFYKRWVRPDNATLLIVGDTTLQQIQPLLEQRLAGWKAPAGGAAGQAGVPCGAALQAPDFPRQSHGSGAVAGVCGAAGAAALRSRPMLRSRRSTRCSAAASFPEST